MKNAGRRFEFSEGTSNKFWEISIEGAEITTRYGKVGTTGQLTTKKESTAEHARKALDKLVNEKTRKGYVEVSVAASESSSKAPRRDGDRRGGELGAVKPLKTAKQDKGFPGLLKTTDFNDIVAASEGLIVSGSHSDARLWIWTSGLGRVEVSPHELMEVGFFCPAENGLAAVSGGRFVMGVPPSRVANALKESFVAVFGPDGRQVGKAVRRPSTVYDVCASSPDGTLVAVASVTDETPKVSIWRVDDLANGDKPYHEVSGLWATALAFAPDSQSIASVAGNEVSIAPIGKGSIKNIVLEDGFNGKTISLSDAAVCVSDGNRATVLGLDGAPRYAFASPGRPLFEGTIAVEHAMLTANGLLIAVAGNITKHYDRTDAAKVKFPDEAMAKGFVGVFDAKGKLLRFDPRAKNATARAMTLVPGKAVLIAQDGSTEIAPWPIH